MRYLSQILNGKRYVPLYGLTILTLLILACSTSNEAETQATDEQASAPVAATTAAPAPTATPTAKPKVAVSPRLKVAVPPPAEGALPMNHTQNFPVSPLYDSLVGQHHQSMEEYPSLASSWSLEPNGKKWTFNLREGTPYYKNAKPSGYELKAEDVVLFMGFRVGLKTDWAKSVGFYSSQLDGPDSWSTPDDHTVVIDLPFVNLQLASVFTSPSIISAQLFTEVGEVENAYGEDPIGNGPWSLLEWNVLTNSLMEKVPNHWRQTPLFDELEYLFVSESATRMAMLLAGEAHLIPTTPEFKKQVTDSGFAVAQASLPSAQMGGMFNFYRENSYVDPEKGAIGDVQCAPCPGYDPNDPFRQAKVREALNYAIDRDSINESFMDGDGFPLREYYPQWRADCDDSWFPYPGPQGKTGCEGGWPYNHDPEKAKSLLSEAGFANGFETTIICLSQRAYGDFLCDVAEALAGYWKTVGVTATIEDQKTWGDFQGKTARPRNRSNWMLISAPGGGGNPCSAPVWQMYWERGNGWREYPGATDFIEDCKTITSIDALTERSRQFGSYLAEIHSGLQLMWIYNYAAYDPGVLAGYEVNMGRLGPSVYHEFSTPIYN